MTKVMEANVWAAAPQGDASNTTAATQFIETNLETYAYRRFGGGAAPPLVFLQHFTGTLDNWDPAVTDTLAQGREVILFESAGIGRSTGEVPDTIQGMASHLVAFADALGLTQVDLLGFSLGGSENAKAGTDQRFPSETSFTSEAVTADNVFAATGRSMGPSALWKETGDTTIALRYLKVSRQGE
jgi:hypothetical protein